MGPTKTKDKRRREPKSTSKPGTSIQPAISADQEPSNFGFLYQIDALETIYDNHKKRILGISANDKKRNDIGWYWFPPIRKSQFKRRQGHIYRWPGEDASERLRDRPKNLREYQVASVFFQAKQDNFLAVLKDCADEDIINEVNGWSQIKFHHLYKTYPFMSYVDIGAENSLLAAPADHTSWMPQVVPMVYNYDKSPLSKKCEGQSEGLCGKLSLLIAMAAFSAPEEIAEDIVSKCFGYKTWDAHRGEVGIGRYQERGVVVRVYLDPDAPGVTESHLKAFEDGKYGPIFDASGFSPTPAYMLSSQSTASSIPRTPLSYIPAHTAASGYPASIGNTAPSGYSARIGNTSGGSYPTPAMITESSDLYEAKDEEAEEDEK